jgi:hypothetical protein
MRSSKVGNRVARTIRGTTYPTVTDAATHLGGSTKALNDWVGKGITQRPPVVEDGTGTLRYYLDEYLVKEERDLVECRSRRARFQSGASNGE